jgi:DNA-binding NarL/FixJ family response regulator
VERRLASPRRDYHALGNPKHKGLHYVCPNGKSQADGLAALRAIREQRDRHAAAEERAVLQARRLGISWRDIGQALGRDVSTVFEKYRDVAEPE